jgi:hypothetical protein
MTIKQITAGIISIACIGLVILNFNSPVALAWIVAASGWIPHMFNEDIKLGG